MNLILFEPFEIGEILSVADPRYKHLVKVLRFAQGDTFDMGIINGSKGKGTIDAMIPVGMRISFSPSITPKSLPKIGMLIPFIRPVHGQRVLRELASLGPGHIWQCTFEKSEKSYAQSHFYAAGHIRETLAEGAAQAFDTQLPVYHAFSSLAEALQTIPSHGERYAFDNYEASQAWASVKVGEAQFHTLAIGPERGWSQRERSILRENDFMLCHLGPRVLKAETACVVGLASLMERTGRWSAML